MFEVVPDTLRYTVTVEPLIKVTPKMRTPYHVNYAGCCPRSQLHINVYKTPPEMRTPL